MIIHDKGSRILSSPHDHPPSVDLCLQGGLGDRVVAAEVDRPGQEQVVQSGFPPELIGEGADIPDLDQVDICAVEWKA